MTAPRASLLRRLSWWLRDDPVRQAAILGALLGLVLLGPLLLAILAQEPRP